MITNMYPLGSISLTDEYFADLVSHAAQNCFGVAGMCPVGTADSLRTRITGRESGNCGVQVSANEKGISIELHIKVAYGVNIRSTVQSISHRVRTEVEKATSLKVAGVNVCVDDIVSV